MSIFRSEHLPAVAMTMALLWQPVSAALIDCVIPARLRLQPARPRPTYSGPCDDYTILVPIFGNIKYLKNVRFLAPYGAKVVLCTTQGEAPEFDQALQAVADRHGFRIFRSEVVQTSGSRTNPWRLLSRTLDSRSGAQRAAAETARDRIIRESFAHVQTTFTIFLDGDTVASEDLGMLAAAARDSGHDIASVRILASRTATLAEKLQAIEYEAAMNARRIYPWLTSGACVIGRTRALHAIMYHHSLFFSGGDIEIGKLAKLLKYSVGHIPFVLYTDVPETLRAWFKQRVAWCGGDFRHAVINSHRYSWRHPFYFLYSTVIVHVLMPLRWYELLVHPRVLLTVIPVYWLLTLATNWGRLQPQFTLYPFYSLVQVMIVVPLGMCMYVRMVVRSRNVGRIRLRPRHQAPWGRSIRRLRPTPQLQGQVGR